MEVLKLYGYTVDEKIKIANRYLIPRQRKAHGLKADQIPFTAGAVKQIIMRIYPGSRAAKSGARNRHHLPRCRQPRSPRARQSRSQSRRGHICTNTSARCAFTSETKARVATPGVATGLAWTPTGGELLFIEATAMKGQKGLTLTGQLGDVMKESATAALSFIRANADELGIDEDFFDNHDIHIHVPAGAIPKDGPSAGVTMLTALTSLLTGKTIRKDLGHDR